MQKSSKTKAVNGMLWTFLEKMSLQVCQFVIGIVLARLLMPEDYGVIGMLAIFMAIAQSLLDSGFNRALIQKKDRTNVDYSTIFYFNLVISVLLYFVFWITAPFIASFYETPILCEVTRYVSFSIILNALSLVQTAKLTIELNFRLQTIASVTSVVLSGVLGVVMAYSGYGVWALVAQSLCAAMIRTLILWLFSHWKPLLVFSTDSFKRLFSFGSKLLIGDFIHTIYTNLYTLVIGKAFNPADVGYYNRANGYAALPFTVFSQVVNKVMFPILSEKQNDNIALLNAYNKLFKVPMFFYVPLMFIISALSKPLICLMIGEKWNGCVPLLQILCIGFVFSPMSAINLNLLYVKGRSDISLKLDLFKKPIGIGILFASIPFGLWWMCFGKALYDFVAFSLNCYYTKKILDYGLIEQLRSIYSILFASFVAYIAIYLVCNILISYWMMLLLGFFIGLFSYLVCLALCRDEVFVSFAKKVQEKYLIVYNNFKEQTRSK